MTFIDTLHAFVYAMATVATFLILILSLIWKQ